MKSTALAATLATLVAAATFTPASAQGVAGAGAKPLTLSLGTVKEKLESSAVRALAKFTNDAELTDALVGVNNASFYVVRRKFDFDVTDKGSFGGVALRYGVVRFSPTQEDVVVDGMKLTQSAGWIHTVPVTLGLDADRSFQNRDVLLEAGYVPFKGKADPSCFKLGGNPIVGIVGQLGHRSRENPAPDFKRSLRRVKVEFKSAFEIGKCFGLSRAASGSATEGGAGPLDALAADVARWRVIVDADAWRDFADRKNHRYAALTLRMPAGKDSFVDFKREVGSAAPNFVKGSQFGAYLTVQY